MGFYDDDGVNDCKCMGQKKLKYVFSYKKYEDWRIDHEKLNKETLEVINQFNDYREIDGQDLDELWKKGRLVIKEWCDYVE